MRGSIPRPISNLTNLFNFMEIKMFTKMINDYLKRDDLILYHSEADDYVWRDDEWKDYVKIKANFAVDDNGRIIAVQDADAHQKWVPVIFHNGEYFFYEGIDYYKIDVSEHQMAEHTVPVIFKYKSVSISAIFTSYLENFKEESWDIQFYHPMAGQMCNDIEQVLWGWSEQDNETNAEWGNLVNLIGRDTSNDFQQSCVWTNKDVLVQYDDDEIIEEIKL